MVNSLIKRWYEDDQSSIRCLACDAYVRTVRYVYYRENNEYKIYRCNSCGFMFMRPIFISDLTDRQMDSTEDAEFFDNPLLKKLHEHLILKKEILLVKKFLDKNNHKLLDVGCGTGWISKIWKDHGFEVTGLEPSAVRAKVAEDVYGIRVVPKFLEDVDNLEKVDIVVLRHVVEHFENPREMLHKVNSILSPLGLVLIIVPNINSIGRYIFSTRWSWILPYHCNFLNHSSLEKLISKTNFEILKIYQMPSPLWYPDGLLKTFHLDTLHGKIYKKLRIISLLPFIPLVMLGYLIGLSDNITVIARKKANP